MPESNNSASVGAFLFAVKRHWITLVGGCTLIVLVGIGEKVSGKNIPLWVYLGLLALLFCTACYLAWRDARKAVTQISRDEQRRQFLATRLQALLNEAGTVEFGWVRLGTDEGMEKIARSTAYDDRVKNFVQQHYGPEIASRYDKEKSNLLESLLVDCYRDNEIKSNTISLDK